METNLLPILHPTASNGHVQTGPKSEVGKRRSRLNAVKHCLSATDEIFLSSLKHSERSAFTQIRRGLCKFYEPKTSFERLIVDRMAIQHLRMLRLYRLESDSFEILPLHKGPDQSVLPHLDRLARYDVRIERQLRILHNRLISLYEQRLLNKFKFFPTRE